MRSCMFAFALALAATSALAHGPQIQITQVPVDENTRKIVTRQLLLDGDYSDSLSPLTSVYAMPVLKYQNAWYSRPNNEWDTFLNQPAFPSGPGLAYGFDLADGGPQEFAAGSVISISFTDRLKIWDEGTMSFVDAGDTQIKAFRGSNANISSPAANFAISSDAGPSDSVSLATVAANYGGGAEPWEVHGSLRWALLGDGPSPTSSSADGVYLVSLQLSSTQAGLLPSDEYYFVLGKNASPEVLATAVASLGVPSELVQYVPEPATAMIAMFALAAGSLVVTHRQRG
jgi:hypothetical protein